MTSKTIDIKISLQQYNCQPGREEYDRFERNLFAHGGISDAEGWSLKGRVLIMMAELDDSWLNEDCHGGAAAP